MKSLRILNWVALVVIIPSSIAVNSCKARKSSSGTSSIVTNENGKDVFYWAVDRGSSVVLCRGVCSRLITPLKQSDLLGLCKNQVEAVDSSAFNPQTEADKSVLMRLLSDRAVNAKSATEAATLHAIFKTSGSQEALDACKQQQASDDVDPQINTRAANQMKVPVPLDGPGNLVGSEFIPAAGDPSVGAPKKCECLCRGKFGHMLCPTKPGPDGICPNYGASATDASSCSPSQGACSGWAVLLVQPNGTDANGEPAFKAAMDNQKINGTMQQCRMAANLQN